MVFKSATVNRQNLYDLRCLITFHNCTPNKVTPYWIDCSGSPLAYPTLASGAAINMNTFSKHFWVFKEHSTNNNISSDGEGDVEDNDDGIYNDRYNIIAIPEECVRPKTTQINSLTDATNDETQHIVDESIESLTRICPLCKFLTKESSYKCDEDPCQHYKGGIEYSVSELDSKYLPNSYPPYVYSCDDTTHKKAHNQSRRNVFLVRSLHKLRDLCFFSLKEHKAKVLKTSIPKSLKQDFEQFVTSFGVL